MKRQRQNDFEALAVRVLVDMCRPTLLGDGAFSAEFHLLRNVLRSLRSRVARSVSLHHKSCHGLWGPNSVMKRELLEQLYIALRKDLVHKAVVLCLNGETCSCDASAFTQVVAQLEASQALFYNALINKFLEQAKTNHFSLGALQILQDTLTTLLGSGLGVVLCIHSIEHFALAADRISYIFSGLMHECQSSSSGISIVVTSQSQDMVLEKRLSSRLCCEMWPLPQHRINISSLFHEWEAQVEDAIIEKGLQTSFQKWRKAYQAKLQNVEVQRALDETLARTDSISTSVLSTLLPFARADHDSFTMLSLKRVEEGFFHREHVLVLFHLLTLIRSGRATRKDVFQKIHVNARLVTLDVELATRLLLRWGVLLETTGGVLRFCSPESRVTCFLCEVLKSPQCRTRIGFDDHESAAFLKELQA